MINLHPTVIKNADRFFTHERIFYSVDDVLCHRVFDDFMRSRLSVRDYRTNIIIKMQNDILDTPPSQNHLYLHYKGGLYEVLTCAKHSETDENMVVYKSVAYGTVWTRPLRQGNEKVEVENDNDGGTILVRRFALTRDGMNPF